MKLYCFLKLVLFAAIVVIFLFFYLKIANFVDSFISFEKNEIKNLIKEIDSFLKVVDKSIDKKNEELTTTFKNVNDLVEKAKKSVLITSQKSYFLY